ncbi:OLC1v1026988C1 [Oldenlandia corymbosa var. corymbosa]|uniref:OLC1v1026988C1 n=1 Tax=Oldenlandia corymbosa var. corymbosa TaxID=529605 RepID=A0AAV1CB51_OLDCO|nr:OLC1v1026988C1 [Oldenlandia corymbosa var. corymbosa]
MFSCQSSSLATVAEAVSFSSVMENCLKLLRGETVASTPLTEGCLKLLREEADCGRLAALLLSSQNLLPLHGFPLLIQILSTGGSLSSSGTIEDCCYELFYLVANAQEDGVSRALLMLTKFPAYPTYIKHPSELATLVVQASRNFGAWALHTDDVKFKAALHFIPRILSSQRSTPVREALLSLHKDSSCTTCVWSTSMRAGVAAILKSRLLSPADKLEVLFLADSTVSIAGNKWLIGPVDVTKDPVPP